MVAGYDTSHVWILGGNQPLNGAVVRDGVEVNITRYMCSLVSKYIVPSGYNAPPLGFLNNYLLDFKYEISSNCANAYFHSL